MAGPTVVLVDDESQVRSFLKGFLKLRGVHVYEAGDGVEALEIIEGLGRPPDLLITDIKMPRMDGVALAQAVANIYPYMPIVFISGWVSETFDLIESKPWHAFLQKPFPPSALLRAIEDLLSAGAA